MSHDSPINEWQPPEQLSPEDDSNRTPPLRSMADLLFLPEMQRSLVNWLLRQKSATFGEIIDYLLQTTEIATEKVPEIAQILLNELINQGFVKSVENSGADQYQPQLITRKGRQVPQQVWDVLEN